MITKYGFDIDLFVCKAKNQTIFLSDKRNGWQQSGRMFWNAYWKAYYHPPLTSIGNYGIKQLMPLEKHSDLRWHLGLGAYETIPDFASNIIVYKKTSFFDFVFKSIDWFSYRYILNLFSSSYC